MSEESLTEWDSSKATLIRIDRILQACAMAALNRDYITWYRNLEVLKREAIVKMKRADHTKCSKDYADKNYCARCHCDDLFNNLSSNMAVFQRARTGKAELMLERQLDNAEVFLRTFMDSKGMLMRETKDSLTRFRGQ